MIFEWFDLEFKEYFQHQDISAIPFISRKDYFQIIAILIAHLPFWITFDNFKYIYFSIINFKKFLWKTGFMLSSMSASDDQHLQDLICSKPYTTNPQSIQIMNIQLDFQNSLNSKKFLFNLISPLNQEKQVSIQ